jgi:predicted enzyme related to lactoylglutathione lyase
MGKQAQRPPELYRIILPVKDIKKASIFYSKLLDLKGKKVSPGRLSGKTGKSAGQAVRGGFYKRQIHILDFCVFPRFRR